MNRAARRARPRRAKRREAKRDLRRILGLAARGYSPSVIGNSTGFTALAIVAILEKADKLGAEALFIEDRGEGHSYGPLCPN